MSQTTMPEYEMLIIETHGRVGLIRLNRPKALNALCDRLMRELGLALAAFDADPDIGAIVLTGSERAFAAGADIKEMQTHHYPEILTNDFLSPWDAVREHGKPLIAAVAGFALGGGCELALLCDIVIAADTAKFGLPEVTLGIIPGAGGTQRLVRTVGKALAMELILTGRMMEADEALRSGVVARVVAASSLIDDALALATRIAALSTTAIAAARQAVDAAFETTLSQGLRHERALFLSLFGTPDQREGMAAFVEKRAPRFHIGGGNHSTP